MELPSHFERFLQNIRIDESKLDRIKAAHSALHGALEDDPYVGPTLEGVFLQGSYVHGTAIRPLGNSKDFDVDVCCLFDLTTVPIETKEPKPLVRWLARRLKKLETYRGMVNERSRCIRIDFPDDFHMDVVPLVQNGNPWNPILPGGFGMNPLSIAGGTNHGNFLVPNAAVNGWDTTNPKGLAEWYRQKNSGTNGRFSRVVRMLKHWRNQTLDENARPPSVGFEVMVANSWPWYTNSDAAAVCGVLQYIATRFSFSRPMAMNPSIWNEDLLRNWSREHLDGFMKELGKAADLAGEALRETRESRSVALWQSLFRRRFPQRGD